MTPPPVPADELKRLLAEASKLPWHHSETAEWPETNHYHGIYSESKATRAVAKIEGFGVESLSNAALIVAAVNSLPSLLSQLATLTRELSAHRNHAENVISGLTARVEEIRGETQKWINGYYGAGGLTSEQFSGRILSIIERPIHQQAGSEQ